MSDLPHSHGDFESRSTVDLKAAGSYVYAAHPSTEIMCFAWCIGEEDPQLWFPGQPNPQRLFDHIAKGGKFYGHNSGGFELPMWNSICVPRYGWPELKETSVQDTMAMAYAMSLPGSLENCAAALGLEVRKDDDGRKIMLKLCKPRSFSDDGTPVWWEKAEWTQRLGEYCIQDVIVEREIERRLMNLTAYEEAVWHLDNRINAKGVHVDLKAISKAEKIIAAEKSRLDRQMSLVTNGAVSGCTKVADLTAWVIEQGVEVSSLAKEDLLDLLELKDLPERVRKALKLRQEGAKSSLAKLKAMRVGAGADRRVRGTLQYHGASTGRWTGRRTQTTNLPRPELLKQDAIEEVFELLTDDTPIDSVTQQISMFYGPPMQVLADCVRGFICAAPGHDLIAADLAAIEARGVAWLAGQNNVLRDFVEGDADPSKPDIYCKAAARLYGRPVTKKNKNERSAGKVIILSMGFGGGVGALDKMAKTYRVNMADIYPIVWRQATEEQKERAEKACSERLGNFPKMTREFFLASDIAKQFWRADNPITVSYWYALENAAISAVECPGEIFSAGYRGREVRYRKAGSFLWAQLPSKRCLCYPYPELRETKTPWGEKRQQLTYMGVDSETRSWRREGVWSGLICENNTQAICRDILVPALMELNARGYYTPQHVYDEAVCEVPLGFGSVQEVEEIMCRQPPWARDFPIAAEGWRGKRYRKG